MRRRSRSLVGLSLALCLSAPVLLVLAAPAGAQNATPPTIDAAVEINVPPEYKVQLERKGLDLGKRSEEDAQLPVPTTMSGSPTGTRTYNFRVNVKSSLGYDDAEARVSYVIGDATQTSKKYVLWLYAKVPHFGDNAESCEIHTNGSDQLTAASPYFCTVTWRTFDKWDPQPIFKLGVKPTQTVTDANQQADLMNQFWDKYCGDDNPQKDRCEFTNPKVKLHQVNPIQLLTGDNCARVKDFKLEWDKQYTHEEDNTVGVKLSGKVKTGISAGIQSQVEVKVEGSYTHAWKDKTSETYKASVGVEPGEVIGLFVSDGQADVTGDFRFTGDDAIYVLPNVGWSYPLESGKAKDFQGKTINTVFSVKKVGDCGNQAPAPPSTTPTTSPAPSPSTTAPSPSTTAPAPSTTAPPNPISRCEVTVQNVTGAGDVTLADAGFGPGDQWDPAPPVGQSIADQQTFDWAVSDPPPGACNATARLQLNRTDGPPVVWNLSLRRNGATDSLAATCTTSDDAFPCEVNSSVASGALHANITLQHAAASSAPGGSANGVSRLR